MTALSEAQSLRDAVARDLGEHLISVGLGRKIGIREFEDFVAFALRPSGPIGAHIAKIEAAHAGQVATLTARIADLEAAPTDEDMKAAEDAVTAEWQVMAAQLQAPHISWPVSPTNWRILRAGWKAIASRIAARSALSNKDAGHE